MRRLTRLGSITTLVALMTTGLSFAAVSVTITTTPAGPTGPVPPNKATAVTVNSKINAAGAYSTAATEGNVTSITVFWVSGNPDPYSETNPEVVSSADAYITQTPGSGGTSGTYTLWLSPTQDRRITASKDSNGSTFNYWVTAVPIGATSGYPNDPDSLYYFKTSGPFDFGSPTGN